MPYTLSHPAFAVPLRRLGLPTTALAIGSLTPDVPLWADAVGAGGVLGAAGVTYGFTHSAVGVLTICVVFGMVLWGWWLVLRAPLEDALPAPWRTGGAASVGAERRARPARDAGLAVIGVWIGAASHALVDELTHEGRWAHANIAWFAQEHWGLAGVKWAQYTGSIGGALVVAGYVAWWLRGRRKASGGGASDDWAGAGGPAGIFGRRAMRAGVVAGSAAAMAAVVSIAMSASPSYALFQALTTGVLIVAAGATIGAVAWWASALRLRRISSPAPAR